MTDPKTRIAIIGGGLSGLTTAICLRRLGYNRVHIYDSKSNNNVQSIYQNTGCIISSNGVRILDKLGIAEQCIKSGININTVKQTNMYGNLLSSYVPSYITAQNIRNTTNNQQRIPVSHIAVWSHILLSVLYDMLPANIITYNHKLTNIHKQIKTNSKTHESYTILRCEFNNQHTIQQQNNDICQYI